MVGAAEKYFVRSIKKYKPQNKNIHNSVPRKAPFRVKNKPHETNHSQGITMINLMVAARAGGGGGCSRVGDRVAVV